MTDRLTDNLKSFGKALNPLQWGAKKTHLSKIQEEDDGDQYPSGSNSGGGGAVGGVKRGDGDDVSADNAETVLHRESGGNDP